MQERILQKKNTLIPKLITGLINKFRGSGREEFEKSSAKIAKQRLIEDGVSIKISQFIEKFKEKYSINLLEYNVNDFSKKLLFDSYANLFNIIELTKNSNGKKLNLDQISTEIAKFIFNFNTGIKKANIENTQVSKLNDIFSCFIINILNQNPYFKTKSQEIRSKFVEWSNKVYTLKNLNNDAFELTKNAIHDLIKKEQIITPNTSRISGLPLFAVIMSTFLISSSSVTEQIVQDLGVIELQTELTPTGGKAVILRTIDKELKNQLKQISIHGIQDNQPYNRQIPKSQQQFYKLLGDNGIILEQVDNGSKVFYLDRERLHELVKYAK
jgi:hypothetical protein